MSRAVVSTAQIGEVIALVQRVGDELLRLRPLVAGSASVKADGSKVTEADKKASLMAIEGLGAITPHIPVVSEEDPVEKSLATVQSAETYWIVDPLDGTRSYIDGHGGFGVHIGLIDKGVPVAGVVFFPQEGTLYYACEGEAYRAEKGGAPQRIFVAQPRRPAAGAELARKNPGQRNIGRKDTGRKDDVLTLSVAWRKSSRPQVVPCRMIPAVGGGRLCLAAAGLVDMALVERPFSYWDVAAAHAVLLAAGGEFFDAATGRPVRYAADRLYIHPAVGGHSDVVSAHLPTLAHAIAEIRRRGKNTPPPSL